jgi:hypothetical protein
MITERELQSRIVTLLRRLNIEPLWHRTDRRSGATVGWPDITWCYHGRGYAWEVKTPTGRLRLEQERMLDRLAALPNGWSVRIVRSVDDAIAALQEATERQRSIYP